MTPTILVIDDEVQILRFLEPTLAAAGYRVLRAASGEEALSLFERNSVSAVVLDLGLPDIDGQELIERIRSTSNLPIIVLSARDTETEKIAALDRGANDYVVKPFSVGELLARLRAVLRPTEEPNAAQEVIIGVPGGHIDPKRRRAVIDGVEVRLTRRETEFLTVLAEANGEVVSLPNLIRRIWGDQGTADAQFVRALACQVRQKIEVGSNGSLVVTEPSMGYRLNIRSV